MSILQIKLKSLRPTLSPPLYLPHRDSTLPAPVPLQLFLHILHTCFLSSILAVKALKNFVCIYSENIDQILFLSLDLVEIFSLLFFSLLLLPLSPATSCMLSVEVLFPICCIIFFRLFRLNYKFYQILCALFLSSNSLGSYFILSCFNTSPCNSSRKDLCVVNFESLNDLKCLTDILAGYRNVNSI